MITWVILGVQLTTGKRVSGGKCQRTVTDPRKVKVYSFRPMD